VHLIDKAPFTISKVLTDSGKEFTEIASVPPASASRSVPMPSIGAVPTTASSTGLPNRELPKPTA